MIDLGLKEEAKEVSIEPAFPPDSNNFTKFLCANCNSVSIEPAFPPDSNHAKMKLRRELSAGFNRAGVPARFQRHFRVKSMMMLMVVSIEPAFPPDSNLQFGLRTAIQR